MIIDAVKQLSDLMKQPIHIKSPRNCLVITCQQRAIQQFLPSA